MENVKVISNKTNKTNTKIKNDKDILDITENINLENITIRKILSLDIKLNNIFNSLIEKNTNSINPISIKYKFSYEFDNGFIEYKRTLISYDDKKDKLLRQIYWRIYQSTLYLDDSNPKCYYIVGIEDNGIPSKLELEELNQSLIILKKSIKNTDIRLSYMYLFNELYKSYLLVVKLTIDDSDDNIIFNIFE
jgi:hypothetical protein